MKKLEIFDRDALITVFRIGLFALGLILLCIISTFIALAVFILLFVIELVLWLHLYHKSRNAKDAQVVEVKS